MPAAFVEVMAEQRPRCGNRRNGQEQERPAAERADPSAPSPEETMATEFRVILEDSPGTLGRLGGALDRLDVDPGVAQDNRPVCAQRPQQGHQSWRSPRARASRALIRCPRVAADAVARAPPDAIDADPAGPRAPRARLTAGVRPRSIALGLGGAPGARGGRSSAPCLRFRRGSRVLRWGLHGGGRGTRGGGARGRAFRLLMLALTRVALGGRS
jgi:hypothetical protein